MFSVFYFQGKKNQRNCIIFVFNQILKGSLSGFFFFLRQLVFLCLDSQVASV